MTVHRQSGFTLVEVVIASAIFVLLLTASAVALNAVFKLSTRDRLTQDVQREADTVQAHLGQQLKSAVTLDAATTNTSTNPNSLGVRLSDNGLRRYYVTSGTLHYVSEAGTDETLLAPSTTITSLTFQPSVDAQNGLSSVRVLGTLSRTKGGQTITVNLETAVTTRPQ